MKKKTIISMLSLCLLVTTIFLGGCGKSNSSGGFNVIVLGHVGHGKSEVTSSIASAYGQKISVDKLDAAKECKSNGVVYHAECVSIKSDSKKYNIYDLPEYKDIGKSIASQGIEPEGVVLVVSVLDGIMPQTREHIDLIKELGINNIVVYISNCTSPDDTAVEFLKIDIESYNLGTIDFIVDCDNFSKENAQKTVSIMDKWTAENNETISISGTNASVLAYDLSKEEGGTGIPILATDELKVTVNNKTYTGRLVNQDVVMILPGDFANTVIEFSEPLSAKAGDKIVAEKDGKTVLVGVLVKDIT